MKKNQQTQEIDTRSLVYTPLSGRNEEMKQPMIIEARMWIHWHTFWGLEILRAESSQTIIIWKQMICENNFIENELQNMEQLN